MLPCYVVLDLETTGGNATRDRITEIAAVRIQDGKEVARWSTLVNPGVGIPHFIQSLTGIDDAMVENAPTFAEVAKPLLDILDGAVLVAHNVRFDHGFLLNELARLDIALRIKTLCTVRLSRKLYPQHKSHGLDAILQRHGLHTQARHRAMGDVDVVLAWLAVASRELGSLAVQRESAALLQSSASTPPHLETPVSDIPDTPGVYLFYGEGNLPLYIGKSINLRTRVMAHFQSASKVAREMRILQEIRRIEWRETAGELGALLLESRLVKELHPVYNRQLRQERQVVTWKLGRNSSENPLMVLTRMDAVGPGDFPQLYGTYRSKRQAVEALQQLAQMHNLCVRALGLESGTGPCFASQIGKCKGVCIGHEPPDRHYLRTQMALAQHRLRTWPYGGPIGIREYHAPSSRTEIHLFDHWCHLGTATDDAEVESALNVRQALEFNLDTYRLLGQRFGRTTARDQGIIHLHPKRGAVTHAPCENVKKC